MAPIVDLISGINPVVLVATIFLTLTGVVFAIQFAFFTIRYPANLLLVGEPLGKRHFSWRTRWRYMTDCKGLYSEAYEIVPNFIKEPAEHD